MTTRACHLVGPINQKCTKTPPICYSRSAKRLRPKNPHAPKKTPTQTHSGDIYSPRANAVVTNNAANMTIKAFFKTNAKND
jgi:hypothetical protein